MVREGKKSISTTSGLDRALRVIYYMAQAKTTGSRGDCGVSEIARELDLSKAVVHRILATLVARGFVAVDSETRRYRLGHGALILGLAALSDMEPHRVARPHMERLARETGETSTFSVRQRDLRVYVDQVLSRQEVRMSIQIGDAFPLYAGSSSKAILAALGESEIRDYLDRHELAVLTSSTIIDRDLLEADLEEIRHRGYAVSAGERQPGAGSVAAPVFEANGTVYGSLSICGPEQRFGPDEIESHGHAVAMGAAMVSRELGYHGDWFPEERRPVVDGVLLL